MAFVEFKHVKKTYQSGEVAVEAVKDATFTINEGELVIMVGPSGAGKTTVLNMLGGMDTCSGGEIWLDGAEISGFSRKQLIGYRREEIGFVFQFYNLIQNLTTVENVELASQICKNPLNAVQCLEDVGLGHRLSNFPGQLSGGEQQRVAIFARALAKNPKLLLCDEPTGALDYQTGKTILKLLQDTSRIQGKTVVIITHNTAFEAMGDRIIRISNGTVSDIRVNAHPLSAERIEW